MTPTGKLYWTKSANYSLQDDDTQLSPNLSGYSNMSTRDRVKSVLWKDDGLRFLTCYYQTTPEEWLFNHDKKINSSRDPQPAYSESSTQRRWIAEIVCGSLRQGTFQERVSPLSCWTLAQCPKDWLSERGKEEKGFSSFAGLGWPS